MQTKAAVDVTIEGRPFELEGRPYRGSELRDLAGLAPKDRLVREEADGTETPIPHGGSVDVRAGDNFFVSVRFRRG